MYAVVEWVDEHPKQVSVVPHTWNLERNGETWCYWPPDSIAKKLKPKDFEALRLPLPDDNWSMHRVRCLRIEGMCFIGLIFHSSCAFHTESHYIQSHVFFS